MTPLTPGQRRVMRAHGSYPPPARTTIRYRLASGQERTVTGRNMIASPVSDHLVGTLARNDGTPCRADRVLAIPLSAITYAATTIGGGP